LLKLNFFGRAAASSTRDNKSLSISGCLDSVAGCWWQPLAPRVLIQVAQFGQFFGTDKVCLCIIITLLNRPALPPTLSSIRSSFSSPSFPPPRADPSPAVRGLRVVDLAFLCSLMDCLMPAPFGVHQLASSSRLRACLST